MNTNSLQQVGALGRSIWLDYIRRDLEDEGVEKFNQPFDTLMAALKAEASQRRSQP